ncbi:SCO7613 C-terminal domain-containing membrane protein [Streptomyces griseoviridis]|uniref:SCO7613 C-terminal domain-containing membrane protein n=1 Tax=Streptomyces griseoviridis TaxID=45398 RepID=UPI003455A2D3
MTPFPPPAEELRLIDAELYQLDARRAQLLTRRAWLIAALHRQAPPPAPPRPETGAPRVQNVLLLLGGVLLALAAVAFTLVGWGRLGIAWRAVVLGAVTLAVLAAPVALLRRGLAATAESVAGLGLALTALDAYALHETALRATDGTGYAAAATAALALVWSGYGAALGAGAGRRLRLAGGSGTRVASSDGDGPGTPPGGTEATWPGTPSVGAEATGSRTPSACRAALRLPLPAALAVGQLPLPLVALAAGAGPYTWAAVLLVTAVADTVVAFRCAGGAVRVVALVGAYGAGGWAALAAGWFSWVAVDLSGAARATALLALLAGLALAAARRLADASRATAHALLGGLLLVASAGTVPHAFLPSGWPVPVHLALGVALLAAVRVPLTGPVLRGLLGASAVVQALALLWVVPVVAVAVLGPVSWVGGVWSGAPADARTAVAAGGLWPPHAWTAPVVLLSVAAVLALAVRDAAWRPRALTAALCLTWAALLTLPAVLQLPFLAALSVQFLAVAAPLLTARTRLPGLVLAQVAAVLLGCSALATRTATLTVLAALALLFAAGCRSVDRRVCAAPAALVYAAALVVASGAAAGWPPAHTALPLLSVPAVAALLAARLGAVSRATVPVEAAGAAAGLLAVGLAAPDPASLSLVLGLCGVIAAGTAARAGRRFVGVPATGLFVLAVWVRLVAWGVAAPEAYTLPVSVPALLVGAVRRRRDPLLSSWTAYGPGLAFTLVPSLATAWAEPYATRPLLLGATALLVTLLGARHRLRAPLVFGGAVLVLVALHELGPYLAQLAGVLPRWVPPALAGVLLLAVGATYERRIRDVRRVREVLGRMS